MCERVGTVTETSRKDRIGICAIFRNEADYLAEWVTFHQAQGVSKFFLFDDKSDDDFEQVLLPFVQAGLVTLTHAPVEQPFGKRQRKAYDLGVQMARNECGWLAFIDVDEFLFSPKGDLIDQLPTNPLVAAVYVWHRVFGTSGNLTPPEAGVIRGYTKASRFPKNFAETKFALRYSQEFFGGKRPGISGRLVIGKSIVRPKMIRKAGVHLPSKYWGLTVTERGKAFFPRRSIIRWLQRRVLGFPDPVIAVPTVERLRINHYWSKSISELEIKASKQAHKPAAFSDYLRWEQVLNQEDDDVIIRTAKPWD